MLEDKILFRESKYITKGENNKYLDTSLYEDTTRLVSRGGFVFGRGEGKGKKFIYLLPMFHIQNRIEISDRNLTIYIVLRFIRLKKRKSILKRIEHSNFLLQVVAESAKG